MRFNFDTLQFEDKGFEPNKIAISASDKIVLWKELSENVERLCSIFIDLKIPKGHPVLIYGHKEHLFPTAILACIKMQIPYVPVDMVLPFERIKRIQKLTGSEVLICCTEKLPELDVNIVITNSFSVSVNFKPSFQTQLWNPNDPLAYIMFTSGSTGEPKGVMISYKAIKSFINWLNRDFGFFRETVFMNQASFGFDISLIDTYYTFYKGATVILISNRTASDSNAFLLKLEENRCSVWTSTPSFVYLYLNEPSFNNERLPDLTAFLLLGEIIPVRTIKLLHERFPGCRVLNSYGPTEATVATTLIEISKDILEKYSPSIPIGYAKSDGKVLIENGINNPEEEGEIIIVGEHVSIGYLNNSALSHEKFFLHEEMRAYRTGDYGYYKDGIVFFNGRKDDQVKLNGYRIELGEVDVKITEVDIVDYVSTIPLKSGGMVKKIVSFIKLKQDIKEDETKAKEYIMNQLKSQLPLYMIPGDICFIDNLPINTSHKIDKQKLIEQYMKK